MDFPEIVTNDPPSRSIRKHRKKPGIENMLAALLSFFVPGLGQLCQGRVGPGIAFLAAVLAAIPLCFVGVGFIILPIAWIWAVVDAAQG